MNLLAALFMVQLLFIVGAGGVQDSELCISLGLSLQYLRVSVVCWLAAMSHHLYATVASLPRRDDPPTYLKYSLFAWGAPLLTLALATFLQSRESHDFWSVNDLTPFNCWFLGVTPTVYAFALPVVLLLLTSDYYLLKAAIVSRYNHPSVHVQHAARDKAAREDEEAASVVFLKVSLIIGLVAACGVAARVWKVPFIWTLFCAGHSLQGSAVALSVACNCRVLKIYARKSNKQPEHQVRSQES
ncbi:Cadherin EGF LAG seven-pass G-type receptor [Ooceraea biroi]|uniref:Cadherin EGF LAG seven-pass G-type receptor n=1 Tax=Ooceraea biroi TaxID=2015173 RepID=A0A026WV17_OOCBI|nr:Cadherin EGF LAG seven-pass G-type receptor [Ooceraea biroi]